MQFFTSSFPTAKKFWHVYLWDLSQSICHKEIRITSFNYIEAISLFYMHMINIYKCDYRCELIMLKRCRWIRDQKSQWKGKREAFLPHMFLPPSPHLTHIPGVVQQRFTTINIRTLLTPMKRFLFPPKYRAWSLFLETSFSFLLISSFKEHHSEFHPFLWMSDDKISKRKGIARPPCIYKNPKIEFKNQWIAELSKMLGSRGSASAWRSNPDLHDAESSKNQWNAVSEADCTVHDSCDFRHWRGHITQSLPTEQRE